MDKLLKLLSLHGGKIVSTAQLSVEDINQAKASNRMYVDKNSLGYVWEPNWYGDGELFMFPVTKEEIDCFDKWFPLPVELPDSLKVENMVPRILAELKYGECVHRENMALCKRCNPEFKNENGYEL